MLDIKFIRENKYLIAEGARKKKITFNVDELLAIDDERRAIMAVIEEKKAKQNEVSTKIVQATPEEKEVFLQEMKTLKEGLQIDEDKFKDIMLGWRKLMLRVPNIPDVSVPEGDSDAGNVEIRDWGIKPQFSFEPKNHIDLMLGLDMVDFERGVKISGFRGYILKNDAVLLQFALQQFVLEELRAKGFSLMITPSMVNQETLLGTGYLPDGADDLYVTQDNDYLSGTAEVPTMSYYSGEILDKKNFPIKILSYSPCFRREAGSHSKDTKGLKRVHEFYKFEQVILCEANHEESVRLHEELTQNSEELLQKLNIPYHVVINCGGDLGQGQVKKYDIEAWAPAQNSYIETHSSSYFHDFQTRRLNIKYVDDDGSRKLAHSLNNTALAFPRIFVPLIENYQNEDGSIRIPEVLQKYMGGRTVISIQ